ncbi:MAG: NAD-dependent epimerase/dehydratase family protein [Dehalococcoidia bacterium]
MKVLVTGYAGFIGWWVTTLLLARGDSVVGLDNFNDAYDGRMKQWRHTQVAGHQGFSPYSADLEDAGKMSEVFQVAGPFDAVINLAARAGVPQSQRDPVEYYRSNLMGVVQLLELCKAHGVNKVVQASTSSVYGNGDLPLREDAFTDRPLSPYAASKKAAELLCYTYFHLYGISTTVLRFFTVYGPAGRPDMSIFRFIRWTAEGEPLVLYGDGTQQRDFTYAEDTARAVIAALDIGGYEVINVGNDRPVELRYVISEIEKATGRSAKVDYQPFQPTDVRATHASIDKARSLLGWQPETPIEQGVAKTAAWYMEHRDWASTLRLG